jgi:predicted acyltransferase
VTDEREQPIIVHGPVHGGTGTERMARGALPTQAVWTARDAAVVESVSAPGRIGSAEGSAIPDVGASSHRIGVAAPGTPAPEPKRAHSLDALRGLLLVSMTLGFTIIGSDFPAWMYHRQFPPPFELAAIPGIGWRDIAYAGFIFTMAAALPITLSRRIEKGDTEFTILFAAVRRFALLFVFGLLIAHSNTFFTGYTQTARALSLIGFAIMFAIFVRRRQDWNRTWFTVVNRAGWIAAIAFLALSPLAYGSTFTPTRIDDIIRGLAFVALSGSIIWYLTRDNIGARLIVLAAAVALYLGARGEGWIQAWWWTSPAPWLFRPSQLTLLLVVIPGTIAGDIVLRWMRASDAGESGPGTNVTWSSARLVLLSLLSLAFAPLLVIGLYNRWVSITSQVVMALCGAGALLIWHASPPRERMIRDLWLWATLWLILGLFLEPFEGGIKKVPETLSYFFVVTGITTMLLVTMATVVDLGRKGLIQPLIDVGHNPMLCYVLYTVFFQSVFELIPGLRPVLRATPLESFFRSVLSTILVVLVVRAFTRKRIYWRT